MMKKSISFLLHGCVIVSLASAFSADAAQTVTPSSAPTGGTDYTSSTQSVPSNGSFIFYGVYSDNTGTPESGLGLKLKYDGTKINVAVSEEYTKCRIAASQPQNVGTVTEQVVMGWIDTSVRTAGAVGWPDLADTVGTDITAACLNASGNTDTAAASAAGLKLFKGVVTWIGTPAVGTTALITHDAEGNFSYANASPSFTNKSFTVQAAAASSLALAATDPIVSRKTHGAFVGEIPISSAGVITGLGTASGATVEPRQATAANPHRIVFKFTGAVTSAAGGVAIAVSTGAAPTATTSFVGNEMIVDLAGVTNGQRVSVNATNINGAGVNAGIVVGFLVGDVDSSRGVNAFDVSTVRTTIGLAINAANFKRDVDVSGGVNAFDVSTTRIRIGQILQ